MLVNRYGTFLYTNKTGTTYELNKSGIVNTKTNKPVQSLPAGMGAALEQFVRQPTYDFMSDIVATVMQSYVAWGKNMRDAIRAVLEYYEIAETLLKIAYNHGFQILADLGIKLRNSNNDYTMRSVWNLCGKFPRLPNYSMKAIAKKFNNYLNNHVEMGADENFTLNNLSAILQNFYDFCRAEIILDICPQLPLEWISNNYGTLECIYQRYDKAGLDIYVYYFYTAHYDEYRQLSTVIEEYLVDCRALNKAPIKTANGIREMVETHKTARLYAEMQKNKGFAQAMHPVKEKLLFAYGDFMVVVPEKPVDLVTEGAEMHHCVGSYVNRVIAEECYIVFVRHKDTPSKCYITAQIYPNGKIGQYFLAYDRSIREQQDTEFYNAYQQHLYTQFTDTPL